MSHGDYVQQKERLISNQINMDFQQAGLQKKDCQIWVYGVVLAINPPPLKLSGVGGSTLRRIRESGSQHKEASMCVHSRVHSRAWGRVWNYSYRLVPQRKALDSHTQKMHPFRFAVTLLAPPAMTPASAAAPAAAPEPPRRKSLPQMRTDSPLTLLPHVNKRRGKERRKLDSPDRGSPG